MTNTKHTNMVSKTDKNGNHLNGNSKKVLNETEEYVPRPYERKLKWRNIIALTYVHLIAIRTLWNFNLGSWPLFIYQTTLGFLAAWGTTAGAHRLFTHRSFKANLPLRVFLMYLHTLAFQESVIDWVRDHRTHHKFTDTDADPHNSKRGFFFSHIGWLFVTKHPDVKEKGKTIWMDDILSDPILRWQKRNEMWFLPICGFLLPFVLSKFLVGAPWNVCWHAHVCRYAVNLNLTWLLNSGAHMWGAKPYDKNITSTDTGIMGTICFGEGWHNYHHVFPWDYKASELSTYGYNFTIPFIDFFAKIGWAYDLKTVSKEMIRNRMVRTGDGTNKYSQIKDLDKAVAEYMLDHNNNMENGKIKPVWGWGDQDMSKDEIKLVDIINEEEKNAEIVN